MTREGYRLWFGKCNDFNLHGVFSRDRGQYELLREIQRLLFSLKTSADKPVLNQDVSRRRLKDSRQDFTRKRVERFKLSSFSFPTNAAMQLPPESDSRVSHPTKGNHD